MKDVLHLSHANRQSIGKKLAFLTENPICNAYLDKISIINCYPDEEDKKTIDKVIGTCSCTKRTREYNQWGFHPEDEGVQA